MHTYGHARIHSIVSQLELIVWLHRRGKRETGMPTVPRLCRGWQHPTDEEANRTPRAIQFRQLCEAHVHGGRGLRRELGIRYHPPKVRTGQSHRPPIQQDALHPRGRRQGPLGALTWDHNKKLGLGPLPLRTGEKVHRSQADISSGALNRNKNRGSSV
jgi:hypothetical protein